MGKQIVIRSVTHSFGNKKILDEVSLECNTGEVIGIFGRNGAGKSTLFNIVFGTLKANQIEIYLDGQLFLPHKMLGKAIGYHTQHIMLPRFTKARDIISMYLPLQKQDSVFFAKGVHEMMEKRINELSLGQQRYLQFLLILNLEHPFVILDEPFSMVEPLYRDLIKEEMVAHKAEKGFLISDHYYRDVLDVADSSYLLKDGKLTTIQKHKELIELGYLSAQAII